MTVRPAWASSIGLNGPRSHFVDGLRLLLQTAQGLPMIGWEVSCRISPAVVSSQRILMGLLTRGVAPSRLQGLAGVLGMPSELAQQFTRTLPDARQILLAVEAQPQDLEIRAYQIFDNIGAPLAMRGYKWMAYNVGRYRVTDYHHADQTWPQVIEHYEQQSQESASADVNHGIAYRAASTIARLAQARRPMQRMADFLVATETTGGRASSCLRLYETGLQFRDVVAPVSALLTQWGIESERANIFSAMTTRPLGWIAVGDDAAGQPFMTLYGQASLLDARRLIGSGVAS